MGVKQPELIVMNSGNHYLGIITDGMITDAVLLSDDESISNSDIRNYVAASHRGSTSIIDLVGGEIYHVVRLSEEHMNYFSYCLTVLHEAQKTSIRKLESETYQSMVR